MNESDLEAILIAYFVHKGVQFKIEHWPGCYRITVGDGEGAKQFCVNDWELPTQERLRFLLEA